MRILSLFRDLYLYTYYYATVVKKSEGKELDPVIGFIGVTLTAATFNAYTLMILVDKYLYHFNTEEFRKPLFFFLRGNIDGFILTGVIIGCVITYLTCCRGVVFNSIPDRLSYHPFLEKLSKPKILILPSVSIAIFVYVGMVLTK
jgi:hypothetical protein